MDILPRSELRDRTATTTSSTRTASAGQHNRDRVSRFTASGQRNGRRQRSRALGGRRRSPSDEHHGGSARLRPRRQALLHHRRPVRSPPTPSDLTNFRGKILRINHDGTVPTDNPFYDGAGPNKDAIWAYGLRNPFRMSIDSGDRPDVHRRRRRQRSEHGDRGGQPRRPRARTTAGRSCEGNCGVAGNDDPIYSYPHSGRDAVDHRRLRLPRHASSRASTGQLLLRRLRRRTRSSG